MKCPKCGFVSYPGILQCKKCGHPFAHLPRKEPPLSIVSPLSRFSPTIEDTATSAPSVDQRSTAAPAQPFVAESVAVPKRSTAETEGLPKEAREAPPSRTPVWREELSGRVQKYRRRRARLQRGFDPSRTLDLEFDADEEPGARELDVDLDGDGIEIGERDLSPSTERATNYQAELDEQSLHPSTGLRILTGAAVQAGEMPLQRQDHAPEAVEIILDSGGSVSPATLPEAGGSVEPRDLMGLRFVAGFLDALVLMLGGGVFAAIFWAMCLRTASISAHAADLIALGFLLAFLIMLYFGASVALTASTPGLRCMGLEVRNLNGDLPSFQESFWRAFGYLVSASALFLGFVWALFDIDGLTWHDLISGTYVTRRC